MGRTLVIANPKGGVGKTTTVANLGVALAASGERVLLIDVDPQAALTASLGLDPYNLPTSIYDVLLGERVALSRAVRPVEGAPGVSLVPASPELAAGEAQLARLPDRALRLRQALERAELPFDFILIDTPPSLGLLTLNALVAAQELLIPVQTHYLAMRGVRLLMETVWRVKQDLNPGLHLIGVLPTMVEPGSRHAREVVHELREVFNSKVYGIGIVFSDAFAEAPVAGQSLVQQQPKHRGAVAYRKLAEVIANHAKRGTQTRTDSGGGGAGARGRT